MIKLILKTTDICKISVYMETEGRDMKGHTSASKITLYPVLTKGILNLCQPN